MKSMTKLIVVAMVLAAALVVAPVAARDATINTTGANVFVGEENLNLTGAGIFAGYDRLVHFSDFTAKSIDKTLSVDANGNISRLAKGIPTGPYYALAAGDGPSNATAQRYVNVQEPSMTLDVVLVDSAGKVTKDSVSGKTVSRTTPLAFKFENNLNGLPDATVKIDVTLPGGGVTTEFGGRPLTGIYANGTTQYEYLNLSAPAASEGTYIAQVKWPDSADFYNKGYDSNTVTFEVTTKPLAITSTKDSVVRGNSFTVTVTGESQKTYHMFVKNEISDPKANPQVAPGQNGVNDKIYGNRSNVTVTTNAGGTRSVQFETTSDTKDQSFTIRVQEDGTTTYDEVKVKVEAGSVTIVTSGTGTYYLGEEITLSGTNTDSDAVYFFLTGPNLDSNGVNHELPNIAVDNTDPSTFVSEPVEADDTWSKKWNTANLDLDAGSYTIYVVSQPVNKGKLSGAKYATAPISLRSGFITATTSGATVAKGDKLTISGTAQGNPDNVFIWIFGKNFYGAPNSRNLVVERSTVESDSTFEYELGSEVTKDLTSGQYFVVVQHPMGSTAGNAGSITVDETKGTISGTGINEVKLTGLQAPAAATALINALDSPNIPDTYVKLTFVIDEPLLVIDPIGTKTAGSKFTISGTTNLAVGDTLNIDVTSAAFQPGQKTEASGFSGIGGPAVVQKGDGANKWSYEVDATGFKPDQYIVKVESIEASTTATATFNVVAGEVTTQPTGNVTTQPAGNVTTTVTTTTTTEATPPTTPGFGALVALAGLGAVAFLVLRRK